MFTRKTEKEPSPDTELFNNRLKDLKTSTTAEEASHSDLTELSSEPLPVPEKLRKRAEEPSFVADADSSHQSLSNSSVTDEPFTGERKSTETVISSDLIIHGSVTSRGVIRLEGTVYGDMHCSALVVERAGAISGNVKAVDVNVHGRVEGTVNGKSVMLHSSAFVEGDIYHQGIGIEMGTHYDGRLQWVDANGNAALSPDRENTSQDITNDDRTDFYAEAAE